MGGLGGAAGDRFPDAFPIGTEKTATGECAEDSFARVVEEKEPCKYLATCLVWGVECIPCC